MPSIQSKAINVLLRLMRMKRAVNPVNGSLKDLAPVTLFIGTRDILYPDCRKLRDKAAAEGVRLDYREYDQMVHNWMLGPMPEAKHAIAEIVETISSNGRR